MPDVFPTVGDPGAMRDLAQQLMARAELIGSTGTGATAPLDDAVFEGRAADRLRGSVSDARNQVVDAATQLRDVARRLTNDATEVERQNALLREQAEREQEAKEQAAKDKAAAASTDAGTDASGATSTTTTTADTTTEPAEEPQA